MTVVPGSPAANAGLEVGDVVTKVGGDSVKGPQQLATRIAAHRAGDEVTITYVRSGKTDTATALARRTVGDRDPDAEHDDPRALTGRAVPHLGARAQERRYAEQW